MAVAATTPILTQLDPRRSEVALELIDDHFPLLLVRWAGNVQPQHVLQLIRFIDVCLDRSEPEQRLVLILDARDAAMPSSLVRDMLIDWLGDRPRKVGPHAMRNFIIVGDPMIRGVVASLRWATGRGDNLLVVPSVEQAIVGAREALEAVGHDVPAILLET